MKEFLMVIEKNGTQHHKAIVSVFPKNSETLYWRLLRDLSMREVIVDCLDFEGFFLLFEVSETEKIGIRIEKK